MNLLLEQIELHEFPENDFDVFYDFNTKRFHAFENNVPRDKVREVVYELIDTEENIITNHREEILNYCLCTVTKDDTVGLGDIFMHGGYLKRTNDEHTIQERKVNE
jgi:hypothetical protein